eukprot:scaffold10585_cov122-Isochrysis_galbana.AAC.1
MRGTLSPCSPKHPPTPSRMPSHRPASPYWPLLPTGDHHRQLVPPQDRSRLGLLFPHTHRHARGGLASLHTRVSFTPPSHDGFTPTIALTAHTGLKPPCWAAKPETRETPSSNSVFACRRQSSPEVDFTLSASIHTSTWISHPPKLQRHSLRRGLAVELRQGDGLLASARGGVRHRAQHYHTRGHSAIC